MKQMKKQEKMDSLVNEAKQNDEKQQHEKFGSGKRQKNLKGGAASMANEAQTNRPPEKKRKPTKERIIKPQGLDFANQAGALMAQPASIEMMPPKDMMHEASKPEKTTSGVKLESMKIV